ncbi:MAG: X2-like carbohydrate binding domain-containing protein, partial [Hespellia sp.]|nr:X2-like carbohydrate binding domain-containing protein [Hespellia sp.]
EMDKATHTFGEWVTDTEATETTTGSKHRDCTICNHTEIAEIPVISHTHVADTTTWYDNDTDHWHKCTADDGEEMDKVTHAYGEWVVDTPATETAKGSQHRNCTVCNHIDTEEIPATGVTPEKLVITAGAGSVHQISNGKDMTLTCTGKLEDLEGIYVDGKLVDKSNYTLKSGSTVLTLKASYLDTLSAGSHTLKFQYKDNLSADTTFTVTEKNIEPTKPDTGKNDTVIKDAASPKTGDTSNTMLYLSLVLLSGGAVVFVFKRKFIA